MITLSNLDGLKTAMGSRKGQLVLLGLVVVVALVLRCWSFNEVAVASLKVEPDSWEKVKLARKIAFKDKSPKYFKHPRLMLNTSAILLRIGAIFGYKGKKRAARIMVGYMVALSIGTLLVIYYIGLFAFSSRRIALTGAFVFAVLPIGVVSPHYIKEDVPVMFFSNLALLMMILLLQTRNRRYYLWCGLTVGLAIGTKLIALTLLPIAVLTHLVYLRQGRTTRESRLFWQLGAGCALIAVGFFLFNHQLLIHFGEFISETTEQAEYARKGHFDGTIFSPWDYLWTYQLRYGLVPVMTGGIVLASLTGMGWVLYRWRRHLAGVVLLAWVLTLYIIVERSPAKPFPLFVRYAYPIIPGLVCFAAFALIRGAAAVTRFPLGRVWGPLLVAAVLAWPSVHSIVVVAGVTRDTRVRAADWIHDNLSESSTIIIDGKFYCPRLNREYDTRRKRLCKKKRMWSQYDVDYVITNGFNFNRYFVNEKFIPHSKNAADCYRRLFANCRLVKRFLPEYGIQTIGFHNPEIRIFDMNECGTVPIDTDS